MRKWLLLALFLFVLMGCKLELGQKEVTIKDVVITHSGGNSTVISFTIKNSNSSIADCYANISLGGKELHKDIGIIEAKSEKKEQIILSFKNKESQINLKPVCREIDESIAKECHTGGYTNRLMCRLVLGKPELQPCLNTNPLSYQLFCIALTSKNPGICNYIASDSRKNWCKAYITGNINLCEGITDEKKKDWCYTDLGMNFKNLTICDKITDLKSRTSCTAATTLNPKLCLEGTEEYKVMCITNIVESTGDKSICELLGERKEECSEVQ